MKLWVNIFAVSGEADPDCDPPKFAARTPFWFLKAIARESSGDADEARLIKVVEVVAGRIAVQIQGVQVAAARA